MASLMMLIKSSELISKQLEGAQFCVIITVFTFNAIRVANLPQLFLMTKCTNFTERAHFY